MQKRSSVISTQSKRRSQTGAHGPSAAKRRRDELRKTYENNKSINNDFSPSIVLSVGTGDTGQLGLGEDIFEKKRPCIIKDLDNIIKSVAGGMHSVCLNYNGQVFTFGCNDEGALGRIIQDDSESAVPGIVKFPKDVKIIDITAGDNHSSALSAEGELYIWGAFRDNNGIIGLVKPYEKVTRPISIQIGKPITKVASGDNHVAVLTEDGGIMTFGVGENGQLGRLIQTNLERGGRSGLETLLKPEYVRIVKSIRFCDVWAGSYCTVARTVTGQLYGCGLNNYKQLVNTSELSILMMTALKDLNNLDEVFRNIELGQHHLIGLTESNRIFAAGRGEYGSLGLGENINIDLPQELKLEQEGIDSSDILNVYANNRTSYVLLRNGTGYSWGAGNTGMLCHGDNDDANAPTKMLGKQLVGKKIVELSPGAQHVIIRAVVEEDNEMDVIVPKSDTNSGDHDAGMKGKKPN